MKTLINKVFSLFRKKSSKKGSQDNKQPKWLKIHKGILGGSNIYISDSWGDMANGTYDKFIFTSIVNQKLDLKRTCIWDVGAHIGYHSLAFAKMVGPGGKVVAFEPNPYNLNRLRKNIEGNPEISSVIEVHEIALGDIDGKHEFMLNQNVDNTKSSGSYLNYGSLPSDRYSQKIYDDFIRTEVEVKRPDSLIIDFKFPLPRLIKIDIEGAEVRFLNGANHILELGQTIFIIEVHNIQNMFHISKIFYEYNYDIRLLDDGENSSSRCFILAIPNSLSK